MEHIVAIIDSIIWPLVTFMIFIMFRAPIKAMLPLIERFKYNNFELSFREGLKEAKIEVEESGIKPSYSLEDKEEIYQVVQETPSIAIIEAWKEIELAATDKIKELAENTHSPSEALKRPLTYLEISGALIPSTARAIRELRSLRNQVAHAINVKFNTDDVIQYIALSRAIKDQINAITELPKQKLTVLTLLILEFNHLIDTGKYTDISIEEIHHQIKNRTVIDFLRKKTAGDSDFTIFEGELYAKSIDYYNEQLLQIHEGYGGSENKKWGVTNQGLCLLIAWTNEIIQQGSGWYPNE